MDEIAQLAAWFHWPLGTLLDLEHADRAHFLEFAAAGRSASAAVEG